MPDIPHHGRVNYHTPLPSTPEEPQSSEARHAHQGSSELPFRSHSGAVNQPGMPPVRRRSQSFDDVSPQVQSLRQRINELSVEVDQKERAMDDTARSEGRLSLNMRNHMRAQWQHEHRLSSDYLAGSSYARLRSRQLSSQGGGEILAKQFGVSFADDMSRGTPQFARLRIDHPANGGYQRIAPGGAFFRQCDEIYQKAHPGDTRPRLFANSLPMADKLRNLLLSIPGEHGEVNRRHIAPGIVALRCEKPEDLEQINRMMNRLGGRPSAYQVIRAHTESFGRVSGQSSDPRVSLRAAVDDLHGQAGLGPAAQLRRIPPELGTAALAHTAAEMLDDLCHELNHPQTQAEHQHNPLVAMSVEVLTDIASAMPAMSRDSARFGNAYRAMMEEMHVILSTVRPWRLADFKNAAMARLDDAIPKEMKGKLTKPEPLLTTSGMQAITTAIDMARMEAGFGDLKPLTDGDKSSPFYYEAAEIVENVRPAEPGKGETTFYASLTDSVVSGPGTKEAGWNASNIANGIKAQLASRGDAKTPLNVIIDTTVEREGDLKTLMDSVAQDVVNNKVRLFLCKSHQKFANLSAAKATGGSLTMVSAAGKENMSILQQLQDEEASQQLNFNDEFQLLTHITRAAEKREPALLKNASDNAQFVAEQCFSGQDGHSTLAGFEPGKPFAMVNNFAGAAEGRWGGLRFAHPKGAHEHAILPHHNLDKDYFRTRGSFGFSESTISTIGQLPGYNDEVWRLSFGQENKAELMERFWMASRLMQLDQPKFDSQQAETLVNKLVNDALSPAQQQALRGQPLGEKLSVIAKQEATPLTDDQRLDADVSEMRGTLATPQKFTMNKIASVLGQMNTMLEMGPWHNQMAESPDREKLDGLIGGMLDAGMSGVSRLGREQIVKMQSWFCLADMRSDDPERRRSGADKLATALEKSGISPALGIFDHAIPDEAWKQLPQAEQDRLMNAIFKPLDVQARLEFLELCFKDKDGKMFLTDCAEQLAAELKGTTRRESRDHWQATLMQEMVARNIIPPNAKPF